MIKIEELKPCPFCGQAPEWNNSKTTFSAQCSGSPDGPFYGDYSSQHRCLVSPSSGDWKTEESAVTAWNTRAPDPLHTIAQEMAEALEEFNEAFAGFDINDFRSRKTMRLAMVKSEQALTNWNKYKEQE